MKKRTSIAAGILLLSFIFTQYCATDQTITWHQEDGYRWAKLPVPHSGRTGFTQIPASKTGIAFTNNLTETQIRSNRLLLNGSGVAIGDVDGDGLADVYFCRLDGPNVLYKNLGNWQFKDITDSAGVACPDQFSSGAVLADIDGDSDLDLVVTSIEGRITCFLNDGSGKFTNSSDSVGISTGAGALSIALADIDGDGDLDLYIATYKKKSAKDIWPPGALSSEFVLESVGDSYRIAPEYQDHFVLDIRGEWILFFETGEPDLLFLNDGKGHFEKVSWTDGRFLSANGEKISEPKNLAWMARFQDMDGDGDPDIYVCNDIGSPDHVWINDGTGRFQAIPKHAIRHTSNSSMAVDFSDIDRDGDPDFLVADLLGLRPWRRTRQKNTEVPIPHPTGEIDNRPQYMQNTLFLNQGDNTYTEIAHFSGLQASEWTRSILFLDVDLDGYEDLLVATGHYYNALDYDAVAKADGRQRLSTMILKHSEDESANPTIKGKKPSTVFFFPKLDLPNIAFHNRGDLTFEEVSQDWGFNSVDISQGMALGDLDNDGDLDVVVNRFETSAVIYRNESKARRIAVRLLGLTPNTQGIGAKIRVFGGPVPQSKEVICGGTYLSSSDPLYVFATGEAKSLTIEVTWRNNKISTVNNVKPNHIYEIAESAATLDSTKHTKAEYQPFFEDVSHLLKHSHHEDPFDDFRRQPLLPERLSSLGPGLAWHDFDADGDDDLIIASGKGGQLAFFRNDKRAGFQSVKDVLLTQKTEFDQSTVLGWTRENGATSLLVGSSNYESLGPSASSVLRYDFQDNQVIASSLATSDEWSIGPMVMADYDNDGDLDLLVAGRSIPGRYPEPASATLYRNEAGIFKADSINSKRFEKLGLISAAVFSDLDADGNADLILAIEWGPVMVFLNKGGRFIDATEELGFDAYHGRWHGVTTGDLNEDGKLDIIATNWGLNSRHEHRYTDEHPLQLFYDDFDKNGYLDIVEAYFDSGTQALLPDRNLFGMLRGLPNIRMRMPNHAKYSRSTLQEIIGPKLLQANRLKANTLAHMVFFNRGHRFEAIALPPEAQFSPAFHVGVADFDGDGHEDVFLSQNFFAGQVYTARADGGRGLWLRGDGSGGLSPLSSQESGVLIYGEQRGAAFSDYDADGRVDLVVSQNGAATKLYHNIGAKPGLRVRLVGPKGNPSGVGATIRIIYPAGYGPAREVHSGSGYWSQDSMVQVMGLRDNVTGIWVRWPGGQITEKDVRPGENEIVVKFDEKLTPQ